MIVRMATSPLIVYVRRGARPHYNRISKRAGATSKGKRIGVTGLARSPFRVEVILYLTIGVLLTVVFVAYVLGMLTAFLLVIQAMLRYKK